MSNVCRIAGNFILSFFYYTALSYWLKIFQAFFFFTSSKVVFYAAKITLVFIYLQFKYRIFIIA